ncbi:hypothetical protein M1446_03395 [Candidatus Dependentiae bacterium]|nr:hypothetical protein [Candidatus Dependentiae bacterium]
MKLKILLSVICFSIISTIYSMAPQDFKKLNGWYDITEFKKRYIYQQTYDSLNLDQNIKKIYFYKKSGLETGTLELTKEISLEKIFATSPRIVLFVIHGTGASEKPWYHDSDNETFKAILNFAKSMAGQNENIEVVSFRWSGSNTSEDRRMAAKSLAELINRDYVNPLQFRKLITFAHSHGGNVVNDATYLLKRPLDDILNLFTPSRLDFMPSPNGFKKYYNFYSTDDQIQYFGSFNLGSQVDWQSVRETSVGQIPTLVSRAFLWTVDTFRNILSGARKIKEHRVSNIRVQIDGVGIAHIEGKKIFIENLKQILDTIDNLYEINDDFDLNIDTTAKGLEKIYLVIRNPLEAQAIISRLNLEDPLQIKEFMHQLEIETAHSDQEAARYKKKYGKDIWYKGLRITGFLDEWLKLFKIKSPK